MGCFFKNFIKNLGEFMIYFDNAATSGHKPQSVINAMNYALKNLSANPGRSGHKLSQNAAEVVYNTRKNLSDFFGSDGPETVVFTASCTMSINCVLKGVLNSGDHIVVSDVEHNAVMRPLYNMNANFSMAEVSLSNDEETTKNFINAIKPNTKMIFCTAASNVLGKILPLKELGDICKNRGILFAVDAAQGAGIIPIDMKEMNIDYLCIAPHKGLYCPMGLGVLIARKPINKTIIEGGTGTSSIDFLQPNTLPEMLESGTVNLPAISTINAGLEFVKKRENCLLKYENKLVEKFYKSLRKSHVIFYTNPVISSYAPVLSFNIANHSSDETTEFLNTKGFALRSGLHCAPTAHKKIGTLGNGTIRFSPSIFNSENDVKLLIDIIKNYK